MTARAWQHVIPSLAVLVIALAVGWLSFTQEPAAAFLFPRIISVVFIILAVWNFARAALGLARVGTGIDRATLINLLPGVAVIGLYVLLGARNLGFYTAGTLTFLVLYTLYDPAPPNSVQDWGKRILVTAIFMLVIYGLFALVLQVQTPRGSFM
ncbi:tripartite tricarboxylate transporter TctB family protein [Nitratireductor sp. XY-223]|uniref:tripartite tricarboxylate transporter TctB family protein n=1 Tax=Nitratireductor sp. XY-223 TaxID=2561926 RepID=UPI0010AB2656|nr:tripartite tricarboxylate transporter TctB family protein [Nitratireductor sp. XY-223]